MPFEQLENRSLIAISGNDATTFLQGLVTANVETISVETVQPCALLTPQGKVAFDFLIGQNSTGYFIDIRDDLSANFLKRLQLYKLRADVDLTQDADTPIHAIWGETLDGAYSDLRFPEASNVARVYGQLPDNNIASGNFAKVRIENYVAVSGQDFEVNDIFPHDIGYDLNAAIDFKKGCYVGQEVVSRMKHKGSARKRPVIIELPTDFNSVDMPVTAGGKSIGNLGTICDQKALAIVRLDRLESAQEKELPILLGDFEVKTYVPSKFRMPQTNLDKSS